MEVSLLLLLLLVLLAAVILICRGKQERKLNLPPGPPRLPIIGNLHRLGKHPHRSLLELSRRYGPLMRLQLGRVPAVVVSSAEMAEEVMKTQDRQFCCRPATASSNRLSYDLSDVALARYSATWKELKKLITRRLLGPKMTEGFRPSREEEVERMVRSISSAASRSEPIDLSKLLLSLSNRIIRKAAFGRGSNKDGNGLMDEEHYFFEILKEAQFQFTAFFFADYFPWTGWLDILSGARSRLEKVCSRLDAFYEDVIAAHLADPAKIDEDDEDLVDVLLRLQREEAQLAERHVKGVLMDVLVGGSDTSSATVEYAMAELAMNPTTMSKAQKEVREAVGKKKKGKVEEIDLPHLPYLKSVVKETLRLHPPAPLLIPRETTARVKINGYDILPKTRVFVNALAIGREPGSWENPDEFIPERFMGGGGGGSSVDFRGQHFCFVPFGAGRRICPGLSMGVVTVELALANLLYSFDWEVPGKGGIDMEERAGITVHLKNNLVLMATIYNDYEQPRE